MVDGFGNRYPETPLAFFPGYPVLVRWVSWQPGVSFTGAAIAVSLVAGAVAAHGLVRLGTRIGGSRAIGLLLVARLAAARSQVVLSMASAAAVFCALGIWAVVGVLERRWALAGL